MGSSINEILESIGEDRREVDDPDTGKVFVFVNEQFYEVVGTTVSDSMESVVLNVKGISTDEGEI